MSEVHSSLVSRIDVKNVPSQQKQDELLTEKLKKIYSQESKINEILMGGNKDELSNARIKLVSTILEYIELSDRLKSCSTR